jgi:hypothetical protein
MKQNYFLLMLVLGLSIASCGEKFDCEDLELNTGDACNDNDDMTEDDVVTSDCNCEGTDIPITYTNTVKAITDASCGVSGCHAGDNPTGGFALETYEQVSTAAGYGRMIGAINQEEGYAAMPQGGKLDQEDIDNITEWINNGTPE